MWLKHTGWGIAIGGVVVEDDVVVVVDTVERASDTRAPVASFADGVAEPNRLNDSVAATSNAAAQTKSPNFRISVSRSVTFHILKSAHR